MATAAITATTGCTWQEMDEHREVPLVLRELQQIKVGRLRLGDTPLKSVLTDIPANLYVLLDKLALLPLFRGAPAWAS